MRSPYKILIRPLAREDCETITAAFESQNWKKPVSLFERYLAECSSGERTILIAELDGQFAGYMTIDWRPEYPVFKEQSIPEIADFNVLKKLQSQGVGTRLMESAEQLISERSDRAGIRVGLTADYGNAQRLYVKRGYIPDGHGISQRGKFLIYGDAVTVDDDLTIGFTKSLR